MRDADKASAASKEKISLSKFDLDEIKSFVSTYIDMKFNDLQKLMVDQYTGLLGVVKKGFASFGKVAQYPVHESEKGYPDIEEDPPESVNEHTTDAKSYNVINVVGRSSRLAISQVPMCKTNLTYVRKNPSRRNRQPSKVCQPPFVSVFDSASKEKEVIQSNKKLKYPFEDHDINGPYAEDLLSKFTVWMSSGLYNPHATKKGKDEYYTAKFVDPKPSLNFKVAQPHINVVFYYLRKKEKLDTTSAYRYTTVNCVFMNYIHHTYTHYLRSHSEIDLSLHDEYVRSMKVASVEKSICEIMQGLCIPAAILWHFIDEVYVPINCKGSFHWVLAVVVLKERCIHVYNSMKGHRGNAEEIKELAEMLSTYLTISDFFEKKGRTDWSLLDAYKEKTDQHAFTVHIVDGIVQQSSGSFVRHQISSSKFDSKKHRTRYASLLWDYGVNKACTGYVGDNQDPPRPKCTFIPSEDTEMIDVEP
ncbi:hypothetical protein T459_09973 [Capsicum annuum]|uniref:Ubiquitin-like protease family profile domain-containing protein n=1 Tax=Capsicum annuum TaxID=4072 RepID=A0A2G3A0V9_CAPAN|nr:hypothetical protein T459_09973 [Capsicum annuum]